MNIYNLKIGEIYYVDNKILGEVLLGEVFMYGYIQIISKTHCIYADGYFKNIKLFEYYIKESFGFCIGYKSYCTIKNVSKHIKNKISRIFEEWKVESL